MPNRNCTIILIAVALLNQLIHKIFKTLFHKILLAHQFVHIRNILHLQRAGTVCIFKRFSL